MGALADQVDGGYWDGFAAADAPMLVFDDNALITDVNECMTSLSGNHRDVMVGKSLGYFSNGDGFLYTRFDEFSVSGRMVGVTQVFTADEVPHEVHFVATANVSPGRHLYVITSIRQLDGPSPSETVRLVLYMPEQLPRDGMVAVLRTLGFIDVVASTSDVDRLEPIVMGHKPDVVLVGGPFGAKNLAEFETAVEAVRRGGPDCPVVAVTSSWGSQGVRAAKTLLANDSLSIVRVDDGEDGLIDAITLAAKGKPYISNGLASEIARMNSGSLGDLSERDIAILRFMGLGYSSKEIAERMNLSHRTVEGNRSSLMEKLGVSRRYELVAVAIRNGLLEAPVEEE